MKTHSFTLSRAHRSGPTALVSRIVAALVHEGENFILALELLELHLRIVRHERKCTHDDKAATVMPTAAKDMNPCENMLRMPSPKK